MAQPASSTSWRERPITVVAPATCANLGPGFDCFGLALSLTNEVTVEVVPSGLHIDVDGEGAGNLALDESHLVVRALRATFQALDVRPAGLRLACRDRIPHARGLGSSAAAIVAGVLAARALVAGGDDRFDDDAALRLATSLEGHPDNVAAAMLGGFTLAWTGADGVRALRLEPRVGVVVLVPDHVLATTTARRLLPASVAHADAAYNAGRAGLLVAALTSRPDLLFDATEDRLHQPQRASAVPQTHALIGVLRAAGHAAVVAGAGPAVLVLHPEEQPPDLAAAVPDGWRSWPVQPSRDGTRLVS